MFLFLNRKERSVLSAEPISALFPVSLCHFLASSHGKQTIRQIYMSQILFFLPHDIVLSFPSCSVLPLLPFGQPKSHHSAESNSYLAHTFFCRMWLLWTLKYTQGLFALPQKSPLHQQPRMHPWGHTHIPCNDETGRDSSVPEGRSCFCSLHF